MICPDFENSGLKYNTWSLKGSVSSFVIKRAEFVVAASRAGFTGIGVYSSFIHLDIGGRRAWVAGEPTTPSDYPVPRTQTARWVELVSRHDRDKLRSV